MGIWDSRNSDVSHSSSWDDPPDRRYRRLHLSDLCIIGKHEGCSSLRNTPDPRLPYTSSECAECDCTCHDEVGF